MATKLGPLPLDSAEECRCWLLTFEAICRTKAIEDKANAQGTSPKTDKFLEMCGVKPLLKIMSLMPGTDIEKSLFADIRKTVEDYNEPRKRLVIADRTNFLQISQTAGEKEVDFLSRLNEASTYCEWDTLKNGKPSEELIKLRFIAGLKDDSLKLKILEKLQLTPNATITDILDLCQMTAQLTVFVQKPDVGQGGGTSTENFFVQRKPPPSKTSAIRHGQSKACGHCGTKHRPRECPAYGKTCLNCGKENHFASVCRQRGGKHNESRAKHDIQNKKYDRKNTHNVDIFSVDSANGSTLTQTWTVGNVPLIFQLDTGAAISLMSENQWKKLGSPALEKTTVTPTNYDGSMIKTLGRLVAPVKRGDTEFQAEFVVVSSSREYGLIGRDLIDKERSHVYTYAVDDEFLPTIKGFSASIELCDEDKPLKFCRARPVPIHCRELLDRELVSLERQGIISPVTCSKSASPVVWVKKQSGRFRMCVDFKATLNDNIKSDAYPVPTVEEVFSRIGKARRFAKVDLKSAYWQIELDDRA